MCLQSDGDGVYLNKEITSQFMTEGIVQRSSCAYTPQQNGVAVRMNRTAFNTARALFNHSFVLKKF